MKVKHINIISQSVILSPDSIGTKNLFSVILSKAKNLQSVILSKAKNLYSVILSESKNLQSVILSKAKNLQSVILSKAKNLIPQLVTRYQDSSFRSATFRMTYLSKIIIVVSVLLSLNNSNIFSQEKIQEDSTINFDELTPENFVYTPDYEIHASYGWFPVPVDNYFNLSLEIMSGDISDLANWISPSGFVKTKFPYVGNNLISSDERKIMRPNENLEVEEEEYPETDFWSIGFHALLNTKFPLILRIHSTLTFNEGLLFSLDETKSFLNYNGTKKQFKEVSMVYIDEILLNAGINCLIPFYGAFAKIETPIQSYYYLSFGINWGYPISSLTTQYSQIVDAKDYIRYNNGQDTVHLLTEKTLSDLNYSRYHANIGLGMEFDIARIGIGLEFYVSAPLNSVVKDALWKQWIYGLKWNFNFMGLFEL